MQIENNSELLQQQHTPEISVLYFNESKNNILEATKNNNLVKLVKSNKDHNNNRYREIKIK